MILPLPNDSLGFVLVVNFTRIGFDYKITDASREQLEHISDALTFHNPKAWFSEAYRAGHWDGFDTLYSKREQSIPWGLLDTLLARFAKKQIAMPINIDNGVVSTLKFSDTYSDFLFKFQKKAIKLFYQRQFGIIQVPTGGGKTVICAEIILNYLRNNKDLRVCFIVDTTDLVHQTRKVFEVFFGNEYSITEVGDGSKDFSGQVVVSTIQSLQKVLNNKPKAYFNKTVLNGKKGAKVSKRVYYPHAEYLKRLRDARSAKEELKRWMALIGFVILDEIQECGSHNRVNTIRRFINTKSLLGLSATPYRKSDPVAKLNLIGLTGGVICVVPEEELELEGVLAQNCAVFIEFEEECDISKILKLKPKLNAAQYFRMIYEKYITRNINRNFVISLVIEVLDALQLKSLVLFTSVEHGECISKMTDAPFIYGEHNSTQRDIQKTQLLKGKLNTLLASNIYNKGINLPEVKALFNCGAGKAPENIIQKRGRVLRKEFIDKDDKAVFIDILDMFEVFFADHSLERLEALERTIDLNNIFFVKWQGDVDDFKLQLASKLYNWFK